MEVRAALDARVRRHDAINTPRSPRVVVLRVGVVTRRPAREGARRTEGLHRAGQVHAGGVARCVIPR